MNDAGMVEEIQARLGSLPERVLLGLSCAAPECRCCNPGKVPLSCWRYLVGPHSGASRRAARCRSRKGGGVCWPCRRTTENVAADVKSLVRRRPAPRAAPAARACRWCRWGRLVVQYAQGRTAGRRDDSRAHRIVRERRRPRGVQNAVDIARGYARGHRDPAPRIQLRRIIRSRFEAARMMRSTAQLSVHDPPSTITWIAGA